MNLESPMYDRRIDKRFYAVSLGMHLVALALLFFVSHTMDVVKTPLVVYGAYSHEPLCAFFKPLPLPQEEKPTVPHSIKQNIPQQKAKEKKPQSKSSPLVPPVPKERMHGEHKKPEAVPPKKSVPEQKVVEQKVVEQKVVEQKKVVPQQKGEPTPVQKAELPQEKERQSKAIEPPHRENVSPTFSPPVNNIKNKKLQHYQRAVQQEVSRVWKPPVGVNKGVECAFFLTLDQKGCVKNFKMVKSSAIPLYDLSVIKVVQLFQFDEILSNKRFVVTFRQ